MSRVFEITLNGCKLPVEQIELKGRSVFRVQYERRVLVLTKATAADTTSFWTFLPAKQPELATSIGREIDKLSN